MATLDVPFNGFYTQLIVGYWVIVRGIKLHVKTKQKKTALSMRQKELNWGGYLYIKCLVHTISKVSKMSIQSGGINFCHLFYTIIPGSNICVTQITLGCTF